MQFLKDIATLGNLPALLKLKKGMKPRPEDVADCFGGRVENNAKLFGGNSAIVCEGKELNWTQFNALANQYANALKEQGLVRNDTVCVMMENRIEFLALLVGLNKLGVTAGLLNTNLTGRSLQHCINVIKAKKCLFGAEVITAVDDIHDELDLASGQDFLFVADPATSTASCPDWAIDLDTMQQKAGDQNPPETGPEHHRTDGAIHLYLRHHRPTQGRGNVEPTLLNQCGYVRHSGTENQARQSNLSLLAPVSRHRSALRSGVFFHNRCQHVRATQILCQRLSQRYQRQQLHPYGLYR
jgi:hypothetical protein